MRDAGQPGTLKPQGGKSGSRRHTLIFELQPLSFPLDHSRRAYLITLKSGRALALATALREQQSSVCLSLEEFVVEEWKVFDSPLSG